MITNLIDKRVRIGDNYSDKWGYITTVYTKTLTDNSQSVDIPYLIVRLDNGKLVDVSLEEVSL